MLSKISAPLGVFSVLGNHDWWEDGQKLIDRLEKTYITVLENNTASISWHGSTINVLGIADDSSKHPNLDAILNQFPGLETELQILMTHDPGIYLDLAKRHKPTLMLAGHTHGGQVNLPIFGRLFIPGRAPRAWAHGWTHLKNGPLLVTSGVGTSILPVRLNQPPEIIMLSLTPRTNHIQRN